MVERMRESKRGLDDFIFPQKYHQDKPDGHLLKIVKRVAKNAGLTNIRVDTKDKFRATYITLQLLNPENPQLDVAKWVGHSNTKTLQRYYEAANSTKPKHPQARYQEFCWVRWNGRLEAQYCSFISEAVLLIWTFKRSGHVLPLESLSLRRARDGASPRCSNCADCEP